jgi:hypothetical protein
MSAVARIEPLGMPRRSWACRKTRLPLADVPPDGRGGVLEVRDEHVRPGVEGLDDRPPVHRPGELDAAVLEIPRDRGGGPRGGAELLGRGEEVRSLACVVAALQLAPALEEPFSARAEAPDEVGHEAERARREDPPGARWQRAPKLHSGR